MLLSYGMHKEAGEVFAQLIDKGATPPVRDRAWYYLAKIRYQRGFIDQAEDAMIRIENNLPPEMQEERALLQAQLLMARADYAAAANVLETLDQEQHRRRTCTHATTSASRWCARARRRAAWRCSMKWARARRPPKS